VLLLIVIATLFALAVFLVPFLSSLVVGLSAPIQIPLFRSNLTFRRFGGGGDLFLWNCLLSRLYCPARCP
jgi:hypothetical protein